MQETPFKPAKIGIVLSSIPAYSETFFRNKIRGLQDCGFEVVLFVDYTSEQDADAPCEVVGNLDVHAGIFKLLASFVTVLLKTLFVHPKRSFRLYQLERADGLTVKQCFRSLVLNAYLLGPDLDWLHYGFGMRAVGCENVAAAIQAKMAVSFRGFDLYLSPLKHLGCYDRLFQKQVRYHVLSEEMKQTLLDYNISKSAIKVITPAIDVDFFKSEQLSPIPNQTIQFITVARLHWKKGLVYTLEALAILKAQGLPFRYQIIGAGEELERLLFAVHQLGLTDEVVFLGKLPQTEIRSHLTQSHLYLQYSIQEGFCNAVLEAQAMGLLCIVSNAEGLAENVLHEHTGWVVTKRRPELLAQRIVEVLKLPEAEIQQFRTTAIARVREQFNLEKQQCEFFEFYTVK